MSVPAFVIASLVRDGGTGIPIAPIAGAVPTADGAGGAVWLVGGGGVTLGSVGSGSSLVTDGAGPALTIRGLVAGSGIALTTTATDIKVDNTSPASSVVLGSAGSGSTLVNSGAGPSLAIKGLIAGSGVTFTSSATDITVVNASPASSVILGSAGSGSTLVNSGGGPSLAIKGLIAGSGITLTPSTTDITVVNASPASSVTLGSVGSGSSLVTDGIGPTLAIKGLIAGSSITFTPTTTDIKIDNTSPASSVTLSDTAGATGVSAITAGTGPALEIRRFLSSSNVIAALSGPGDILYSLATALTNILTITGASASTIDFSVAGTVRINSGSFIWNSQPKSSWSTPIGSTPSFITTLTGPLNAYYVPMPINAGMQRANSPVGFTVDAFGVNRYNAGLPTRICKVTYTLTVDMASENNVPTRNLHFYIFNGGVTPPASPPASTTANTTVVHLFGSLSASPTSTNPVTISDQVLVSGGDNVQLAVIFDGTYIVSPTFYTVSCTIEGMMGTA